MLRTGLVAQPSYRGDLRDIADSKFKTRRSFCKATGLSEDMLSHFLAGRKELSLESLDAALRRIGYRVGVLPSTTLTRQPAEAQAMTSSPPSSKRKTRRQVG